MTPADPKTININQAMALAGVSRRTIYNWIARGKLTILRTPGGNPRFYEHEVIRVDKKKE